MATKATKRCKDCEAEGIITKRPAKYPGPRCATHHRDRKKATRAKAHAAHIMRLYGLTPDEYDQIYEAQGGRCAICQRATGARKRLPVDHDHADGEVRGLLCTRCNDMLGHLRDDREAFVRAAEYLERPPARVVLGYRFVPEDGAPVRGG